MYNLTSSTTVYPAISPDFILALKVVVGATCILSILGAGLIILTYVAFRDLRTTARQLLVNLSIADIIVAASHFVGLFHFQQFIPYYSPHNSTVPNTDTLCKVQAAFTMFGSLSSFLWTMAIAVYMFVIIVLKKPEAARKLVFFFYPLCWGIPLGLVLWFGFAGYFGFQESADIGWCYVRHYKNATSLTVHDLIPEVLGYEIWCYLAFIVLPILYIATFCHVKFKLERVNGRRQLSSLSMHTRARTVDLKLIFVPLIFLLLRIWSSIIDVPVFYLHDEEFTKTPVNAALVLLAGVGDSAQGLANAILFCALTRQARRKLCKAVNCCPCNHNRTWIPSQDKRGSEESTTHLESSMDWNDNTPLVGHPKDPLVEFSSGTTGQSYNSIERSSRSSDHEV